MPFFYLTPASISYLNQFPLAMLGMAFWGFGMGAQESIMCAAIGGIYKRQTPSRLVHHSLEQRLTVHQTDGVAVRIHNRHPFAFLGEHEVSGFGERRVGRGAQDFTRHELRGGDLFIGESALAAQRLDDAAL